MDNFLTTYKKDYKWPTQGKRSNLAVKFDHEKVTQLGTTADPCCRELTPLPSTQDVSPAQTGAPPASPASKFNQPDTFLKKLYEKYPYLYNVLRMAPAQDLVKRVLDEKYTSTYQHDFGKEGFDYREKMDILDTVESSPCQKGEKMVECQAKTAEAMKKCTCAPESGTPCSCQSEGHKKIASKPATISKMPRRPRTPKKEREAKEKKFVGAKKPPPKMSKPISEYNDTISRLGKTIIVKKLLYPKSEDE